MSDDGRFRTTLRVRRGSAGEAPWFDAFELDVEPGQSVLDALRRIRREQDASLAVRYACINANACKECVMRIDGRTGYACTTRLVEGVMTLEPLANKPLIRDLVTDTVPPAEHLDADGN